jgi:hypothetical protein
VDDPCTPWRELGDRVAPIETVPVGDLGRRISIATRRPRLVARARHNSRPTPATTGTSRGIRVAPLATMRARFPWGLLALALYMVSLAAPCAITPRLFGGGTETVSGLSCLLVGIVTVPWYANPLLLFAVFANALRAHGVAIIASVAALIAALTLLAYSASEVQPDVGYAIWLASMAATIVASITRMHDRNAREARERELLALTRAASRDP